MRAKYYILLTILKRHFLVFSWTSPWNLCAGQLAVCWLFHSLSVSAAAQAEVKPAALDPLRLNVYFTISKRVNVTVQTSNDFHETLTLRVSLSVTWCVLWWSNNKGNRAEVWDGRSCEIFPTTRCKAVRPQMFPTSWNKQIFPMKFGSMCCLPPIR